MKKSTGSKGNRSALDSMMPLGDGKKNAKVNKRASSSLDADPNNQLNMAISGQQNHHQSHLMGNGGGVQVSQGGTLLIGPGGRPKTSSGKHANNPNGQTQTI